MRAFADPLLDQAPYDFKAELRDTVKSQELFTANYCSYLVHYFLRSFCCCLERCYPRNGYCNRRMTKYKKFEKALERLADESDIIRLI